MSDREATVRGVSGWLTRLARDTRGNTMAIVAASLIPLAGMVGGGIDISRMYIVKTRLQHACDAGALAGRKQMGGGTWAYNNYQARTAAENFFDGNIRADPYGATNLTSDFTESAGRVSGTATAALPMTIMRIFGKTTELLTVTCSSEMRLPNTDVMFVLDVTGSMGQKAVSTDTDTKIEGLRKAVKCFYEIVARLDTDAVCDGGAPSGGTGSETQIRFGFVPYDMNVNVGRLLANEWVADRATYQSRERTTMFGVYDRLELVGPSFGGWTQSASTSANTSAICTSTYSVPADEFTPTGPARWPDAESAAEFRVVVQNVQRNWRRTYNSTTKACALEYRERTMERRTWYDKVAEGTSGAVAFPAWAYKPTELNVAGLKTGAGWNQSVTLPIGDNHTDITANWDGCIEERETVRASTYWPIPDDARDLDIDSLPSASDSRTQWRPALNSVIYQRKDGRYSNSGNLTRDTFTTFNQTFPAAGWYTCPTAARKLQAWPNADDLDTYVDNMWGGGNTYHDIGLIWGARLMSPDGLFAAQNKFTPQGAEIERHLIFMTDGEACTANDNYQAYGLAWYDRRQTDEADVPTDGCNTTGTLTQQVNARTAAICSAVKNKNITLWVVWFGASNAGIEGRMRTCASQGRFFTARNSAALQQTFRSIANQISQLRLTS